MVLIKRKDVRFIKSRRIGCLGSCGENQDSGCGVIWIKIGKQRESWMKNGRTEEDRKTDNTMAVENRCGHGKDGS